jgi:hypothetical protein
VNFVARLIRDTPNYDLRIYGTKLVPTFYIFTKIFVIFSAIKSCEGFMTGVSAVAIRDAGRVEGRANCGGPERAVRAGTEREILSGKNGPVLQGS